MIQRRNIVLAIAATSTWKSGLGWAQAAGEVVRRVGVLTPSTQVKDEITLRPFYDQMRKLGWFEGRNVVYDRVYADDQPAALSTLSSELVARQPDVIFAPPSTAALAAMQATQTIPIVFATVPDAVGMGLVKSLAHPGGNVTGISSIAESLTPKRIELLRQILPGVKRLGMLGDSNDPITRLDHQALAPIAASLGLTLVVAEAANPAEFEPAVARLIANRSEAIFPGSVLAYNFRGRLIELANESHVPVIGLRAVWADSGALFSYGTSLDDQHRLDTAPRRPRPVQGSETAKARLLFLIWVGSVVKQLQRRQVLIATGGLLMRPVCSAQTTGRAPVVGLLSPFPMPSQEAWANTPFSKRLRELGWIEGKNIVVEQARSDGKNDRLAGLAEGLVRKKVDVIFAVAPDAAVIAARATNTIPIVFVAVALPTELGLVASLASPGGNVTGVAFNAGAEMQLAKPLELLKQIAPSATRLAVIYSAVTSETVSGTAFTYPAMTDAIRGLGFNASVHTSERDEDLGAMFASMIDARAQAILALAIPFTTRIQRRIAEFAVQNRLPTASDLSQFVESGMLVSQGPDLAETTRGAVDILDRVLRGARPATLPVELPRRFEVAVNLKTAKAIGLTIPHSILLSADKVIS